MNTQVKQISEVIKKTFVPREQIAASILYRMGYTEKILMEERKELLKNVEEPFFLNTCNALRDIEKGFREPLSPRQYQYEEPICNSCVKSKPRGGIPGACRAQFSKITGCKGYEGVTEC